MTDRKTAKEKEQETRAALGPRTPRAPTGARSGKPFLTGTSKPLHRPHSPEADK